MKKSTILGMVGWFLVVSILASFYIFPNKSMQITSIADVYLSEGLLPVPCNNTLIDGELDYLAKKTCLKYHYSDISYTCYNKSPEKSTGFDGQEWVNPFSSGKITIDILKPQQNIVGHELFHAYQDLCTNMTKTYSPKYSFTYPGIKDRHLTEGTATLYEQTRTASIGIPQNGTRSNEYNWIILGFRDDFCHGLPSPDSCRENVASQLKDFVDLIITKQNVSLEWIKQTYSTDYSFLEYANGKLNDSGQY